MNTVFADRIVQDHTETLLADAARARLARQAGRARRRKAA
jgi:hypothetical protein